MGLETGTFIDDLVDTNPPSNDLASQGDDHIRLLKTVLKNTFPNANKAFRLPRADGDNNDVSFDGSEQNMLYFADASGGALTVTLPTLDSGDAGWECSIIKSDDSANPVFIAPPSGSIRSGSLSLDYTRRGIPRSRTRVWWDGGQWYADRVVGVPVGSLIPFVGADLPVGYVWPNGQTLNTDDYPDYADVRGSGTTPDHRGRVTAGKDDMGGVAAGNLTDIIDGTVLGETGDSAEFFTIGQDNIPNYNLPSHTHAVQYSQLTKQQGPNTSFNALLSLGPSGANASANTDSATQNSGGSDDPFPVVQPTIVENLILVVE